MSNFLLKLVSPTALLYSYVGLMQVAYGLYSASESEAPPSFSLMYSLGFFWIVGWWLLVDSRKRGVAWVYDMGLFLSIAWPFILPYYLFKTRGVKGILPILAFVSTYVAALGAGMALSLLLAPRVGVR